MIKSSFLHIKLAGGATSQLLGLMNAIYASDKLGIPFKISYYPYSTGTYWPFAIKPFLRENEIIDVNVRTVGLNDYDNLEIGKLIMDHPLMIRNISYEKVLSFVRKCKLEPTLNFLRRELTVMASPSRLSKISSYYKTLSGGFASINNVNVNKEMNKRFISANIKSPYKKVKNKENIIVIHYRLGDKRTIGKNHKDFSAVKILDPKSYKEALNQIAELNTFNIYVISEEPKIAQSLLAKAGINAKIGVDTGSIWDDLYFASQSDIFIGSDSQVSQLANIYVENNGGKSLMLNFKRDIRYKKFKNTKYFNTKFLDDNHEIYKVHFTLDSKTHISYIENN